MTSTPSSLAGVDHVLGVGPQRGAGTLPGVAAVEQQRARAAGLHALDQRGQVGEAADLAVGLRRLFEIQVGEGVGLDGVRLDAEVLEQLLADQVRHLAELLAETEIDVRLAEVDRQQLGVAVGDVQQADVAELGQVVEFGGALLGQREVRCAALMPPAAATAMTWRNSRRFMLIIYPLGKLPGQFPGRLNYEKSVTPASSLC
jgi:hypothetical protein